MDTRSGGAGAPRRGSGGDGDAPIAGLALLVASLVIAVGIVLVFAREFAPSMYELQVNRLLP